MVSDVLSDEYAVKSVFNESQNLLLRRVARALSEDSRLSVSDISKMLDISRKTVSDKIKQLETEMGARYAIEFNERALGLVSPHLTLVKFEKKPTPEEIKGIFEKSDIPQIVATVKGNYDLLIYSNYFSDFEYAKWDKKTRIALSAYGAQWGTSELVHKQLGFFPLRQELISKLDIKPQFKKMLEMLNENARVSFAEISSKMGIHFNTAAYNFNRLMKKGYINRFTLAMNKPKNVTLMTFFARYSVKEGYESASANARKAFMDDDPDPLISRYLITAPLIGAYDFFTLGAFDSWDAAYKHDILYHKKIFSDYNVHMAYGEIEDVLIGRLPIRSVDTKSEYNILRWG